MLNLVVFTRMPKPVLSTQQWGYVSHAFVRPAYRNGGAGRLLLDAAIDEARSRGFVRLVLNPSTRSVPFYERAGFRPSDLFQLDL
jgi:GNAT superfamily N-acetyltransferase